MSGIYIGATLYEVMEDGATQPANEQGGGSVRRAFAGNSRSSIQWEKRNWRFTLYEMTTAQINTLKTATAGQQAINCGNAADLMGVVLSCRVIVGDARYIHRGTTWTRVVDVTIAEV